MKQRPPSVRNHFAEALSTYKEASGRSLRDMSIASGVSGGDLSRIRAGKKRITTETLYKLVAHMKPEESVGLVIAFLKDTVPPGLERAVNISSNLGRGREVGMSGFQRSLSKLSSLENIPQVRRCIMAMTDTVDYLLRSGGAGNGS